MPRTKESWPSLAACHRLMRVLFFLPEIKPGKRVADSSRILDMPIEIRLMIYEQIDVVHTPANIPLLAHAAQFSGTLVNTTLEGLPLLATCRQLREEAGKVLCPRLAKVLRMSPMIIVDANHMIGLANSRVVFTRNILQMITDTLKNEWYLREVHGFYRGTTSMRRIRFHLRLQPAWSDEAIKALLIFIIRIEKRVQSSTNECPPITLVISKPSNFWVFTLSYSNSVATRILARLVHGRRWPRRMVLHAPFLRLIDTFAYRVARLYRPRVTPQVSFTILMDFPEVPSSSGRALLAESYRGYFETGIAGPIGCVRPRNVVVYGGWWSGLEE